MIKPRDPRQLVLDLIPRSICSVQVAAVIADNWGIWAWGWNGVDAGFGLCAEAHAIRRANKRRLSGSTIYVASVRRRNSKTICSAPCVKCQRLIKKWNLTVVYRDSNGEWV